MGFLFDQAPIDEVALAREAEALLDALEGDLNEAALETSVEAHGLVRASMALRLALESESRSWRAGLERIDVSAPPPPPERPARLLIVPGLFYREHPEVGADGVFWKDIAERCGVSASIIETRSLGTVEENSEVIWQALQAERHPRIWLLSMSKGSADVHLALSRHRDDAAMARVEGWINVSGVPNGTPLVDRVLKHPLRRLFVSLALRLRGGSLALLRQLHPESGVCVNLKAPARLEVINIVGVPIAPHLRESVLKTYRYLAPWGPNDGTTPILRACVRPGVVYPIWGADHYLRVSNLSALAYRLMIALGEAERR